MKLFIPPPKYYFSSILGVKALQLYESPVFKAIHTRRSPALSRRKANSATDTKAQNGWKAKPGFQHKVPIPTDRINFKLSVSSGSGVANI